MDTILLFFALPVATIILAIVLQKVLSCPILVAATAFAIYLIVTFAVFDESFLIFAIVYTILAYLTALLTRFICCLIRNNTNPCLTGDSNENNTEDECGCGCNRNLRSIEINNRCRRKL